jgi:two-component system, NarL family, sensor kinase
MQGVKVVSTEKEQHYKDLLTLKTIAETLNQSHDLGMMLQVTLEKLLELTNMKTGWIFLVDDIPHYQLMADHHLPPALSRDDKDPMRCTDCLCLRLYWEGSMNESLTIIECERLHNAVSFCWGETHNLTHHATIPLTIRGENIGLLNVGSPGKEHFSDEELALLQSIAFQIGTAVERTRRESELCIRK